MQAFVTDSSSYFGSHTKVPCTIAPGGPASMTLPEKVLAKAYEVAARLHEE